MTSSALPRPFQDGTNKGIALSSWRVTSTKTTILNTTESDSAQATLHLPLPEICFGNNRLVMHDERSGLQLEWNALDALHAVGRDTEVKVAYADEWARGQASSGSADVAVQKPYDWTYTTVHPGSVSVSLGASTSSDPKPQPPSFISAQATHPGIPLHLLARQDIPILFFDEIPLFEDELGDNGIAELVVRVRVNHNSIFVLSRFFLRIDHVLFRIFDVRLYHALGSNEIIREQKGRQASYDSVKQRLPLENSSDLTPLTDINWVHAQLEALANGATTPPSAPSRSSGSASPARFTPSPVARTGVPVPTSVQDGLGNLSLREEGENEGKKGRGERRLPVWEAEGVRLEVLEVPQ